MVADGPSVAVDVSLMGPAAPHPRANNCSSAPYETNADGQRQRRGRASVEHRRDTTDGGGEGRGRMSSHA